MTGSQPKDAPRPGVSLADLAQRFPQAFGSVARPLKIGIHADLVAEFGGAVSEARAERVNDFATPDVMNLLCRAVAFVG